jgi:hypothetical protein
MEVTSKLCPRSFFFWLTEDELIYKNTLEVVFDTTDTINYLCACAQSFQMVKLSCRTVSVAAAKKPLF